MDDLVDRMRALRDRKGLVLADALIRQAARDSIGTIESLGSRFMLAGLPQPADVLRQLVELREEATRAGSAPATYSPTPPVARPQPVPPTTNQPAPNQPAPNRPAPTSSNGQSWSGPPAWYREREKTPPADNPQPQPQPRPAPEADKSAGPPSWYTNLPREAESAAGPVIEEPRRPAAAAPEQQLRPPAAATESPWPAATPPAHSAPTDPPTDPAPTAPAPTAQQPVSRHRSSQVQLRVLPTEENLPDPALVSAQCDAFESPDHRLRLKIDQGRVILNWQVDPPPAGAATVYLVCASETSIPEMPGDGVRVLATMLNQVMLPVDTGQFFAVFGYSVADVGELSTAVGVRQAIGRVLLEVDDLQVTAQEHGVLLGWTRPAGVSRVKVMRSRPNEPLPIGPDPTLVVPFTGDMFRDADVEPGASYAYRVYTEARPIGVQDGSWESSTGLVRLVTIPGRPEPVAELTASVQLRYGRAGVTASWLRPARGEVRLYLAAGEPSGDVVVGVPQSAEQFAVQEELLGRRVREPIVTSGDHDSIDWVSLDTQTAGGRQSRWTVSTTTEFAGTVVIGAQQVVVHVGDIDELAVDERVDWQLLRSSWPTGATFLGLWIVDPGAPSVGGPQRRITRDEFDEHGGIFLQLPPGAQDLLVQGAARYGPRWVTGGQARASYQGRWVVRYELAAAGRFGGARRLQIAVERPDWPDLSFVLVASQNGFPLHVEGPGVTTVAQGELPGSALVPGQYVPAAGEVKLPKGGAVRMLAWSSTGVPPIVIDPLDPPTELPPAARAPALRCPRCLRISDLRVQHFRCQGTCLREPDLPLTELLHPGTTDPADLVTNRPVFAVPRTTHTERNAQVLDPPVGSAFCPRAGCGQISHQHVCPHCHSSLPPNWWANDVLGVVMIGARSSGKTTYLSALMRHLDKNLLPAIGGHLHPIEEESEAKLGQLRAGLHTGELATGTQGVAANAGLLRPMLASIGTAASGRYRTLSVFDVAGEDMTSAVKVRPYSPALTGADLIVLLIDPLQLDGVRDWLDGTVPLPTKGAPAVDVVQNVVQEIRRQRGIAAGPLPQRLAVAFAKFDGLQEAAKIPQSGVGALIGPGNALWRDPYAFSPALYFEPDGRRVHDEVRALLLGMGETALVSSVEAAFREVQYFAVSALGHGPRGRQLTNAGASPQRVGDPLRWLLWLSRWER